MLTFTNHTRVFLGTQAVDLRKTFRGLINDIDLRSVNRRMRYQRAS